MRLRPKKRIRRRNFFSSLRDYITNLSRGRPSSTKETKHSSSSKTTGPVTGCDSLNTPPSNQTRQYDSNLKLDESTHQAAPSTGHMTPDAPQSQTLQIPIDDNPHQILLEIDHMTPNISQIQNGMTSTDTNETASGVYHLTPGTRHTETYQTSSDTDQKFSDENNNTPCTGQINTLQTLTYTTQTVRDNNHTTAVTPQTRTLLTFTYTIQAVPSTYHMTPDIRQTSIDNIRPVSDKYFMTPCTRQTKTLQPVTYIIQTIPDINYETPDTHKTEIHQASSDNYQTVVDINHMTPDTPQSKPPQTSTDIIQTSPNINHLTSDTPQSKPLQISADTIQTAPDINYMTPDTPQGKPLQTFTGTTHTAPDIIHMTPGTPKGKPRQLFFSTPDTVPDITYMTPDISQSNPLQTTTDIIQTAPDVNHMTLDTPQRKPIQTPTDTIQTVPDRNHMTPDNSQVKTHKTSTETHKTVDPPNLRQTRPIEDETCNSGVGPHDNHKIIVDILLQIPFIRKRMEGAEMTSASNGCKWTPAMRDLFILDAAGNVDDSATKIFGENPFLGELSHDPILSAILKHILHERKDYFEFDSVTNCFRNFIQNFISGSKIDSVCRADRERYFKLMRKWAFDTLKGGEEGNVWSEPDLSKQIGSADCLKYYQEMGILVERAPSFSRTVQKSDTSDNVSMGLGFVHEIFCDWFATYYVIDTVINNPANLDQILGAIDPFLHRFMYRFVCGLCNISLRKVLKYLKDGKTVAPEVFFRLYGYFPSTNKKREEWKILRLLCNMEQPEREWPEDPRKSIRNLCVELKYDDTCMPTIAIIFMKVASWKKISIRELRIECFQSVNRDVALGGIILKQGDATSEISTLSLQSPPVLPPCLLIEKLGIELQDDVTTSHFQGILDYCVKSQINTLEFCSDSQDPLRQDDNKEFVPDFNLDSSILNAIRSKGMTIDWIITGSRKWYNMNLQTGKFERTSQ